MEDDFTNKAVWKKQISQDGREYYINLISGMIKYPPKQNEKKVEVEIKKSNSDDHYIQQYTVDKVPFFVNMRSGVSSWTLPEGTPLTAVKYITHLTPEGIPYYEDTEKKTTSWTLPVEKLSTSARRTSVALVKMNRRQSNVFMASVGQDGTPMNDNPQLQTQTQTNQNDQNNESDSNKKDSDEGEGKSEDGKLFQPRSRNRPSPRLSATKSGSQPRRLSNMAQKSQNLNSTSNNNDNQQQKGIVGMNDVRALRANQRQQSMSKINTKDDDIDSIGKAGGTQTGNKKPFSHDTQRDSPTISDVSSVTAASHPNNTTNEVTSIAVNEATKPLVRTMFEKYEKSKCGYVTLSNLQDLCYDFGTYLSKDELTLAISEIDLDRDGRISYEEFMVWWRTNDQFSTMKLSDAHTKMRTDCSSVFKSYDKKLEGQVTRQEFSKIHRELVREKLVKIDLDTCVSILDSKGDGIIYFNDFISWVEKGQSTQPNSTRSLTHETVPKQKSIAKFFGSLLGGTQESENKVTNTDLIAAKDHPDYAKYFRMASMGGNVIDIRKQMRDIGLDENIIHTPEKLISKQSKLSQSDHLKQTTIVKGEAAAFGSYLNSTDFHDDESDGKSTVVSAHIDDRDFTSMFKKKPPTTITSRPSISMPSTIEVFLSKPLGITLGENVEDEEKGVHVSSCAAGGNAANTGLIEPGMILLEACGEDVRFKDFDSVMDILRSAPAGEKIKLIFSKPVEVPLMPGDDEPGDSDVSETSSLDKSTATNTKSIVNNNNNQNNNQNNENNNENNNQNNENNNVITIPPSNTLSSSNIHSEIKLASENEPNDSDVSETSSVDRSQVSHLSSSKLTSNNNKEDNINITAQKLLSAPERRDSTTSTSSTISKHSQVSKTSQQNNQSQVLSLKENPLNNSIEQNVNILTTLPSSNEEKIDIVIPPNSTVTRSSFALRKAAAIRNAAARRKVNTTTQSNEKQLTQPTRGVFGISTVDSNSDDDNDNDNDDNNNNNRNISQNNLKINNNNNNNGSNNNDDDFDDGPPPPVLSKSMLQTSEEKFNSQIDWKQQEPIISISNPHLTNEFSLNNESNNNNNNSVEHSSPALENSQIIGRPRAPRKALPSILNRMKRQQSNGSVDEKKSERGGIARIGSRQLNDSPTISQMNNNGNNNNGNNLSRSSSPSLTQFSSNNMDKFSMNDIGSTGREKVPIPSTLLEKNFSQTSNNNQTNNSKNIDHQYQFNNQNEYYYDQNNEHEQEYDREYVYESGNRIGNNNNKSSQSNYDSMSHLNSELQVPIVNKISDHNSNSDNEKNQRNRRVTPIGRHMRGMRNLASKQQQQQPIIEKPNINMNSSNREQNSQFVNPSSPYNSNYPSQKNSRSRNEDVISSRNQTDSDNDNGDYSNFSPQMVYKSLGGFSSNWNDAPLSIPRLGGHSSPSERSKSEMSKSELSESESSNNFKDNYSNNYNQNYSNNNNNNNNFYNNSNNNNSNNYNNNNNRNRPMDNNYLSQTQIIPRVRKVDVGVQSDYAAYIDEHYLNSYQMLLGERQKIEYMQDVFRIECEERLDMLHEEELSMLERIRIREEESYQRIREEENRLTIRVREVDDIIFNEKEDIMRQWQELHEAEIEMNESQKQKTTELLELMHIVRAHHDKLQADKKKIGRQRLQLDMALQDLNKFNHFNPNSMSPVDGKSVRRGYSPNHSQNFNTSSSGMLVSSGRRPISPSPSTYLSSPHLNNSTWQNSRQSPSRASSRERSFGSTR